MGKQIKEQKKHEVGLTPQPQSRIRSIVTQSDILKFICQHEKELNHSSENSNGKKSLLDSTLSDLGLYDNVSKTVVCVGSEISALESFRKMFRLRLSCLGIVRLYLHCIQKNGILLKFYFFICLFDWCARLHFVNGTDTDHPQQTHDTH